MGLVLSSCVKSKQCQRQEERYVAEPLGKVNIHSRIYRYYDGEKQVTCYVVESTNGQPISVSCVRDEK